ncbi:MAG: hypothetical protein WCC12_20940 [Anaerolineales bacterium]
MVERILDYDFLGALFATSVAHFVTPWLVWPVVLIGNLVMFIALAIDTGIARFSGPFWAP